VRQRRPELVFAVVGPLGADLERLTTILSDDLRRVGYRPELVRLSELMRDLPRWRSLPTDPLDAQVESHQRAGNTLRRKIKDNSAVVLLGIADIRDRRIMRGAKGRPQAFIIRSLKRPEEVHTLRGIFGTALFVVAAHTPIATRIENLAFQIARSRGSADADRYRVRAEELIQRDTAELDTPFGQNLRDTFPEADVIVDASKPDDLQRQVARLIRIIFSAPFETPTASEFAMFHAKAAALRSADLGRQVGAAIVNADGDVIAVGANDVPRAGGGLYWPDASADGRDFTRPQNDSQRRRRETLAEVFNELKSRGWINPQKISAARTDERIVTELSKQLKDTRLMNLGEFGRSVHAEMAALLDAARRGVSVKGADLYSSTFPCHNCAKHIVAAGIARVRFIEPYPESLATELHDDSLVVDPTDGPTSGEERLVRFETFVGVAPRRYLEFFSKLNRKDRHGEPVKWLPSAAKPRFPESLSSAPELAEFAVLRNFKSALRGKGLLAGPRTTRVRKGKSSGTNRKRSGSTKR
jgi:cytidine deaminase